DQPCQSDQLACPGRNQWLCRHFRPDPSFHGSDRFADTIDFGRKPCVPQRPLESRRRKYSVPAVVQLVGLYQGAATVNSALANLDSPLITPTLATWNCLSISFWDSPLPSHRRTWPTHSSAACLAP